MVSQISSNLDSVLSEIEKEFGAFLHKIGPSSQIEKMCSLIFEPVEKYETSKFQVTFKLCQNTNALKPFSPFHVFT